MNRYVRILILALTLTTMAVVTASVFWRSKRWAEIRPAVAIAPQSWLLASVDENDASACDENAKKECAADPANPRLWKNGFSRTVSNRDRLFEKNPTQFWLGAIVSPDELLLADRAQAHDLMLGWINAQYSIWLNGVRYRTGSWGNREPLVLTLPPTLLKSGKPLSIAIQIDNKLGHARPDQLNYTFGQNFGEGFFTQEYSSAFRELTNYAASVRPMALFVANIITALFFFLLWGANREKQEYFQLAVFTFMSALFQLVQVDIFFLSVDPATAYKANFYAVACEGFLGLLLALSFARIWRKALPVATLVTLLLPAAALLVNLPGLFFQRTAMWMNNYFNPAIFFIGATACFYQLVRLRTSSPPIATPSRSAQLRLFGIGMAALGTCSLLQGLFWFELSLMQNLLVYRSVHFALVVYLGWVALREYRQQLTLLRKTPVSPYHRRAVLPERITGTVLCVDIKGSEWLFRAGAKRGDAGSLASACLSHLWAAAAENGGCVLQTSGDGLIVFFDRAEITDPLEHALRATDTMAQRMTEVLEQFREQGVFTQPSESFDSANSILCFRAGLAYGDIRPVWQETKDERRALWAEAGQSNPLLEAARLMELERSIDHNGNQVVIAHALAQTSSRTLNAQGQKLLGKHGKVYEFSVYRPPSVFSKRTRAA